MGSWKIAPWIYSQKQRFSVLDLDPPRVEEFQVGKSKIARVVWNLSRWGSNWIDSRLSWSLRLDSNFCSLQLTLETPSQTPPIDHLGLFNTAETTPGLTQTWKGAKFLKMAYCGAWPESPLTKSRLEHFSGEESFESWWLAALRLEQHAWVGGALSFTRFASRVMLNAEGLSLTQNTEGLRAERERPLISEPVWMGFSQDGLDLLEKYAHLSSLQMKVHPPRRSSPAGWGTWQAYDDHFSATDLKKEFAALQRDPSLRRRMAFFEIDHGWENVLAPRRPEYDWFPRPALKKQWKSILGKISKEKKWAGLWIAPFAVNAGSRCLTENSKLLVREEKGFPQVMGGKGRGYALDPTRPAAAARVRSILTALRKQGIRYIKADYLRCLLSPDPTDSSDDLDVRRRHHKEVTRVQAYRQGLKLLRQSMGSQSWILACGAPLGPAAGLADSMRIGSDIRPYWTDGQSGISQSVRNIAATYFLHRRWWINDPDDLVLDGIPNEILFWATALALSGGPITVSAKMAQLKSWQKKLIRQLIPPYGQAARPLDLLKDPDPKLWVLPIHTSWEDWNLLGLFNWEESPRSQPLEDLLEVLRQDRSALLWDVWEGRALGSLESDPHLTIPGRSVRLIAVRTKFNRPQILGTDHHFTQGAMELKTCSWNPQKLELKISLSPLFSDSKEFIYIRCPANYQMVIDKRRVSQEPLWDGTTLLRVRLNPGNQIFSFREV
ncbi:MAG: hypothetical protein HY399_01260 [Elusimicrobia bacterium]|nr:hypothetical protein [Elusimicrobiota bacterium]